MAKETTSQVRQRILDKLAADRRANGDGLTRYQLCWALDLSYGLVGDRLGELAGKGLVTTERDKGDTACRWMLPRPTRREEGSGRPAGRGRLRAGRRMAAGYL